MNAEERGGALESLTVLDLSEGIAGPYAAQLMARFGARVIKVERPVTGDAARAWGPYVKTDSGAEESLTFLALNAGKLSLTLDYETPQGAAVLRRLAEDVDGIIEDHPSRRRAELGLSAEELIARIPRLVIVQVSGYGASGPYQDRPLSGLTLAAAVGALPGDSVGPAYDRGLEHILGMNVFAASLAALSRAAQTEHGQVVDVGGMHVLAAVGGAPRPGGEAAVVDLETMRAAGLLEEVEQPGVGVLAFPVAPFQLSKTPAAPLSPAPRLGEHTDYVLKDLIEMDAAEVEALRALGAV